MSRFVDKCTAVSSSGRVHCGFSLWGRRKSETPPPYRFRRALSDNRGIIFLISAL